MTEEISYRGTRTLEDWDRYESLTQQGVFWFRYKLIAISMCFGSGLTLVMLYPHFSIYDPPFMVATGTFTISIVLVSLNRDWDRTKRRDLEKRAEEQTGFFQSEIGRISEEGLRYRYEEDYGYSEGFISWSHFKEVLIQDEIAILFAIDDSDRGTFTRSMFESEADWNSCLEILRRHIKERTDSA